MGVMRSICTSIVIAQTIREKGENKRTENVRRDREDSGLR